VTLVSPGFNESQCTILTCQWHSCHLVSINHTAPFSPVSDTRVIWFQRITLHHSHLSVTLVSPGFNQSHCIILTCQWHSCHLVSMNHTASFSPVSDTRVTWFQSVTPHHSHLSVALVSPGFNESHRIIRACQWHSCHLVSINHTAPFSPVSDTRVTWFQ